jgi:hypothetical protein
MTGNIVLLGSGVARAGGQPVLGPVISTAAFALESGFGGILARRVGHRHPVHVGYALGLRDAGPRHRHRDLPRVPRYPASSFVTSASRPASEASSASGV